MICISFYLQWGLQAGFNKKRLGNNYNKSRVRADYELTGCFRSEPSPKAIQRQGRQVLFEICYYMNRLIKRDAKINKNSNWTERMLLQVLLLRYRNHDYRFPVAIRRLSQMRIRSQGSGRSAIFESDYISK